MTPKIPHHLSFHRLYAIFLEPQSGQPDYYRKELLVNILLAAFSGLAGIAFLLTLLNHLLVPATHPSFISDIISWLILLGLLLLSRRGYPKIAANGFIGLLCIIGVALAIQYSPALVISELVCVAAIVVAGVLVSARVTLLFSAILSALILVISYAQTSHLLHPDLGWRSRSYHLGDGTSYAVVFIFIGIISWLSIRQIETSLHRAHTSELALQAERDSLEVKVARRTKQLEQAQLSRVMELQRLATFGQLYANLLHDMSSPLTAASLNLEQVGGRQRSIALKEARQNLQQMERYVVSARQQLRGESNETLFNIAAELDQIKQLTSQGMAENQVALTIQTKPNLSLFGDSVKFSQLVVNLLSNAMQSFRPGSTKRSIDVSVLSVVGGVELTVKDTGSGMSKAQQAKIFTPFFSQRADGTSGMGIGLAMVKQYVERDFHGSIAVKSAAGKGSSFTITLHSKR